MEISNDQSKDENVIIDWRFCPRTIQHVNCSNPRIHQHIVDRTEEVPSDETQINNDAKKRRVDGSTDCLLGRLPEDILHDILSRLSICDLLRARLTCVSWHRIVSSCNIFQQLYDGRSQESWIALTSDPHGFCLFNNTSNKWYFFQVACQADLTKCWLLQGAADGLMLFVSTEGKMVAANALTRRVRLLPDTKVSPRLGLRSCLKKKLWESNSRPTCAQPSVSINIVVDATGKTFKVMVWGELRSNQVHALVYSSATDKWTVRLCSDIGYRLFRRPFHSTVDGNTVFYTSIYNTETGSVATYDTETGLFVVKRGMLRLPQRTLGMIVERVQNIKMMVYKSQVFMLGIIMGFNYIQRQYTALMGLLQVNLTDGHWELLTTQGLQFSSGEVAAAYDGKHSITIFSKMQGSKMIFLNLDTKEWTMSEGNNEAWKLSDRNVGQQQITFRAFDLKLKFCRAV